MLSKHSIRFIDRLHFTMSKGVAMSFADSAKQINTPASRWNTHWKILHPSFVQSLLQLLDQSATRPAMARRIGKILVETPACLEFPIGELMTPGLKPWLFIWYANQKLSDPYPPDGSKGRFNCQGLEFLIRIEDEPLLSLLLAAKHINQWRFAISLRISSQSLQAALRQARTERNAAE
jgi:hypothetical protein